MAALLTRVLVVSFFTCVAGKFDAWCARTPALPMNVLKPELHVYAPGGLYQKLQVTDLNSFDTFASNLSNANFFKKGRQVVFIIHGFMNDVTSGVGPKCGWQWEIKDLIMSAEDSTVVIVSWGWGSNNPLYSVSVACTQTVGDAVAGLANSISKLPVYRGSTDPNDAYFYCIGHSLGGQSCGQAGRKAKALSGHLLFNRITTLDPAGPGFEICTRQPTHVEKADAVCVENIHTDGNATGHSVPYHLGSLGQWGHIDFYPNGGANQPACSGKFMLNDSGCSHGAAIEYFQKSLKNRTDCTAVGVCAKPGDPRTCGSQRQSLGFYSSCHKSSAKPYQGMYFVDVSKSSTCQIKGDYCPPIPTF